MSSFHFRAWYGQVALDSWAINGCHHTPKPVINSHPTTTANTVFPTKGIPTTGKLAFHVTLHSNHSHYC